MDEIARNTEGEGTFLQVRKIGNSLGLILSKERVACSPKEGDVFHRHRTDRTRHKANLDDPKHAKAMEIAWRSFQTYADTYKALAE